MAVTWDNLFGVQLGLSASMAGNCERTIDELHFFIWKDVIDDILDLKASG